MFKLFRKYNRHLMAVLVVFLMIAWLVQDSWSRSNQAQRTREMGTIAGRAITAQDINAATFSRTVLDDMNIYYWRMPWQAFGMGGPQQPLRPDDYTLLWLEARNSNIDVPEHEIDQMLKATGSTPDAVERIRRSKNLTVADIRNAVADFIRVGRLARAVTDTVHVSEDEVRHSVAQTQQQVGVAYVACPAEKFVDASAVFTDEQIKAHFEKYRDKPEPLAGAEFGYQWPPRVVVEYLALKVEDLRSVVTISDEQIRAHYMQNRPQYMRVLPPLSTQPASAPANASQPASAPSTAPALRQMSLKEARPEIEAKLKSDLARGRAKEIMESIITDLERPWTLGRNDAGVLKKPSGVDSPSYWQDMAKAYTDRFRATVTPGRTALLTQEALRKLPGIGAAGAQGEQADAPELAELAFRIQPLVMPDKDRRETEQLLSPFAPAPHVFGDTSDNGQAGNLYVIRVVEARLPETPATLDEVKDRVVADLRLMTADGVAEQMAQRLYAAALVGGLKPALDADPELKDKLSKQKLEGSDVSITVNPLMEVPALVRKNSFGTPVTVPGLGAVPTVIDAAFAMTAAGWTSPAASQPAATQPAVAATQPTPKVQLVHLPDARNRVVMELRKYEPLREDEYQKARGMAMMRTQYYRKQDVVKAWFDPAAIAKRLNFVAATPSVASPVE